MLSVIFFYWIALLKWYHVIYRSIDFDFGFEYNKIVLEIILEVDTADILM